MKHLIEWIRPMEIPRQTFVRILNDFRKLEPKLAENGVVLVGCREGQLPTINAYALCFEVPEPSEGYFDRPLFNLPRVAWLPGNDGNTSFGSCVVSSHGYALAVRSALLVAKHHLGRNLTLIGEEELDWFEAREFCQGCLGFGRELALLEAPESVPAHGSSWDAAQEEFLLKAYRKKAPLSQVAREMGRTAASLRERLIQLGELSPDGLDPRKPSPTVETTASLFRAGFSLEEIAAQRSLAPSTVGGHLASAIWLGADLDVDRLLPPEDREVIGKALPERGISLQRLYRAVQGKFDYTRLKIGWAACRPHIPLEQRQAS